MSGFFPSTSGGTPIANENTAYEFVGWGSMDQGTALGSAGVSGTKGTAVQLSAGTSNDWAGFTLWVAENGNRRCLIDISLDGGTTWAVENVFVRPGAAGTSGGWISIPIHVNVPASSTIHARVQNASTGASTPVALVGKVRTSNSRPLYSSMKSLTADTTSGTDATRAGPIVNIVDSLAWTEVLATMPSGGADALMAVVGEGASYAANKRGALRLGVGGVGAEVEFYRQPWSTGTGNPLLKTTSYTLIEKNFTAGQRIAACLMSDETADSAYVGIYRLLA